MTTGGRRAFCIVIGGGPAGLMAAERLSAAGHAVAVYERMPTIGRKLLMAGRGGLNLTHSEPLTHFATRYGAAMPWLEDILRRFSPDALRAWCHGLGQETFVGSSGRVFPRAMKASPLLRAWVIRLRAAGVIIHTNQRWTGWTPDGRLRFAAADGSVTEIESDATLLALGGASWPRLGSDGAWVPVLAGAGVPIAPLSPANCGVEIRWSDIIRDRFSGSPLKRLAVTAAGRRVRGEAVITQRGLEGGAIYALTPEIRREIETSARAKLILDLRPDLSEDALAARLRDGRGKQSLSTFLAKAAGLSAAAIAVAREAAGGPLPSAPQALARTIKAATLTVAGLASIERAISSAGGIQRRGVDEALMLKARPGVFVAGEMLDWEAPTGGYLLQGSFATAIAAADGMLAWLARRAADPG